LNSEEAEQTFWDAVANLEAILSDLPDSESSRHGWHWALHNFGHSLEKAGRLEEAEETWRKAVQVLEPLVQETRVKGRRAVARQPRVAVSLGTVVCRGRPVR
jgi:tetratricopeptide (TPR) repeat protein